MQQKTSPKETKNNLLTVNLKKKNKQNTHQMWSKMIDEYRLKRLIEQ